MTKFVLDCTVVMGWCFTDEQDHYSIKVLESLIDSVAIVPELWQLEISNVLLSAIKRKRITEAALLQFINSLNQLPIEISYNKIQVMDLFLLSQKFNLSAYDGVYLNLCLTMGLPLATKDIKLQQAIKDAGGILYLN